MGKVLLLLIRRFLLKGNDSDESVRKKRTPALFLLEPSAPEDSEILPPASPEEEACTGDGIQLVKTQCARLFT
jgi:hypothetical protein